MGWNSLKDLTDRAISQKGIKKQIQESLILESTNLLLADFLSDKVKDKLSAVYFKSGVVTIAVLDDTFLDKLIAGKASFISQLNDKLGEQIIENLNFLT